MTDVPDYISPILGYRIWQWDVAGLCSFNGEFWQPGKWMEARCKIYDFALWRGHQRAVHGPHRAPLMKCTCGIYAHKSLEHVREHGYQRSRIHGQVSLWGTVVEHQQGWRAQYAYPKSFFLAPETLPITFTKIEARLLTLTSYRCDIFILQDRASLPLWKEDTGFVASRLDYLTRRGSRWYAEHNQVSAIKQGDRVTIVGRGTAVVEDVDRTYVRAVLGNNSVVRILRRRVCWNQQNVRWETDTHACFEANGKG
jgi:preprotein translocase subunit YajC